MNCRRLLRRSSAPLLACGGLKQTLKSPAPQWGFPMPGTSLSDSFQIWRKLDQKAQRVLRTQLPISSLSEEIPEDASRSGWQVTAETPAPSTRVAQ